MKRKSIFSAAFALLSLSLSASASTVENLDVGANYNFQLDGGGGGSAATLNGVPVEILCDDFYNNVWLNTDYTADVTTLSTSANLSQTRFGNVSSASWVQMTGLGTTDDNFFNTGSGSSALARYEMAAYLDSQYNQTLGDNTSNNEIQLAVWTLLDPQAEGPVFNPDGLSAASYLEQAVTWYNTMNANQTALNAFLSQFEIVSPIMTYSNGVGIGGFQEQIVMTPTPTPEPRGAVWVLFAMLITGFWMVRRRATVMALTDRRPQAL